MSSATVDFSQPIYLEGDGDTSNPLDQNVDSIDLNDPSLLSSEMDVNAEVDAYAAPPPLPDGRYRVKLKQIKNKSDAWHTIKPRMDKGTGQQIVGQNGKPEFYAFTQIQANVVAPGTQYDNAVLFDRFVSTMQQRNGGIPIVRILTVLGVKLPEKSTAGNLLDTFFKALAGEPEIEVDTVWEGGLDEAGRQAFKDAGQKEPRVLGMHRFPKNGSGQHVPDITVKNPVMGDVNLHAQVRINGYFPLGSGKK